jgi:YD repeat-containing protein
VTYLYDNLGRLTSMTYPNGRQVQYSYGAVGGIG